MSQHTLGDLCQQPTLTASSEQYAQLAHDATSQLHEPVQSILSALNLRALALTKVANFDGALRDANVMLQLSSSSALGYLRKAEVYSEQGKQRRVMVICSKGLDKVDNKDTHYATLKQVRRDAFKRLRKRIDFMRQLPVDIVLSTLIPMIMKDNLVERVCPYLKVSKLWSDLILQCFKGLRFKLYEGGDLSQVIQYSQHATLLHMLSNSKGKRLGDLIGGNDFSSLERLVIENFRTEYVEHFLQALKSVSNTLAYLEVQFDIESDTEMWVEEMMLACPNLVTLRLYDPPPIEHGPGPLRTWPTLTTLSVHNEEGNNITYEDIIAIFERFPGLKELDIYPCEDVWTATTVSEYVPLLNRLRITLFGPRIHLYYQHEEHPNEELGLKSLLVETGMDVWDEEVAEDIRSIIKKYHNTLEHLEWKMDSSLDSESIEHLQYPRLKKLCISSSGWQIPRNAPLLEELELTTSAIIKHSSVLDMIPPRFKRLELNLLRTHRQLRMSLIQRYFDRIARAVQLKELVMLFNSEHLIKNRLDVVYRLAHLEYLRIQHLTNYGEEEIDSFLDGLVKACPRLTSLDLELKSPPATSSVNILKRLERFEQFKFCIQNLHHDDATFWHAICTFTQLKRITIYPEKCVIDNHVKHVRRQRPDLKIIIGEYPIGY
ncbi:hypothetical protein O0I10_012655 [Lichtheimia ornata]|uniref:F-box domain-containing protein n=1 Tax=Lichtheimia ornata TaxID=688661 RepID=A0AAD7URE4_9FUNG|nr:uncharacterized protein O0I10_012655 [Lichtheimia ornata]KAJ8651778.1 hypothetical protein O0I10_012655 [Lichtheimia ornata]